MLQGYAVKALAVGLGFSLIALLVIFLQARALTAELKMERERTANLTASLEATEKQLARSIADYQELDALLAKTQSKKSALSRQVEALRHDVSYHLSIAGQQVRDCMFVRLPAAVSDRLRGKAGDGDKGQVHPATGEPDSGDS